MSGLLLLSLLIVVVGLIQWTKPAQAAASYISELKVAGDGDKASNAKGRLSGYTVLDHDLNEFAGGDYVYLGSKTTTNVNDAIRGLILRKSSSTDNPKEFSWGGVKWTRIASENLHNSGDLNSGADGKFIWLYYTKDPNYGSPITKIGISCNNHNTTKYTNLVYTCNGGNRDLNQGADGAFLYLNYETADDSYAPAGGWTSDYSLERKGYAVYENVPASSLELYNQLLKTNNLIARWVSVANGIYGDMYVGSDMTIHNATNLQAAINAINKGSGDKFSSSSNLTLYLNQGSRGIVFTNFQFEDPGTYYDCALTQVKEDGAISELEAMGITVAKGTTTNSIAGNQENTTLNETSLSETYNSTQSYTATNSVSNSVSKTFGSTTTISSSTDIKIPFVGQTNFSVSESLSYSVDTSKTVSNETSAGDSITTGTTSSTTVPAHTVATILRETSKGSVTSTYNNQMILLYDVYIIDGSNVYGFAGTSSGISDKSNAAENLFNRRYRYYLQGYPDEGNIIPDNTKGVTWKSEHLIGARSSDVNAIYTNIPLCPYGGKLTLETTTINYKVSCEPLYALANTVPSVSTLSLKVSDKYYLNKIKVKGTDKYGVDWYGWNTDTAGAWVVEKGPGKIAKDSAGNYYVKATGVGKIILRFNPTKIPSDKKASTVNCKGVTITVTEKTVTLNKIKYNLTSSNTATYVGYKSLKDAVTIPSTIKYDGVTYKVTEIADSAFSDNKNITSVVIGKYVTKIGTKAFYNCTGLKKVTIGTGVKEIGASAFQKCTKLSSITIKTTGLTSAKVGKSAFASINAKAVIKVPSSKLSAYKTLLKAKGVTGKSQKIQKL